MENLCSTLRRLTLLPRLTRPATKLVYQLVCLSILATSIPASAQESAAQKELSRKIANVKKAHELLLSGDKAYQKKDYQAAVTDYATAFHLIPTGSFDQQRRQAAAERYATAATEYSRALARAGDYQKARDLLDTVLKPNIAPMHLGALKLRRQLDDPIRYNPALTPAHVRDIQKVAHNLRIAHGHSNLGNYDQATQSYQAVLRTDPYNKAARRGMEKNTHAKADYYRAAQDETRAAMLMEVDKAWETSVPPEKLSPPSSTLADDTSFLAPNLTDKLAQIKVDLVDFDNITLSEALDFIRLKSREGDTPNAAGELSGVNIVLNVGNPSSKTAQSIQSERITLKLRDVPLSKILDYITEQTHTQWRPDGMSILVTELGNSEGDIITRTFRVPPTFLQSTPAPQADSTQDIFSTDEDSSEGKLPQRVNIVDFLKQSGVTFPKGASATYSKATSTLIIRNTQQNISIIENLIRDFTNSSSNQVVIQTTIMRIKERKDDELGFDWALGIVGLGNNVSLTGGSVGNTSGIGVLPGSLSNLAPITAGLRSGDSALANNNALDTLIAKTSGGFSPNTRRAPGVFTVTARYKAAQIQMVMRGLNQKTASDVLVKPSIIAHSGERSKIELVREVIYPTEYEPPQIPAGKSNSRSTSGSDSDFFEFPVSIVTPASPTAFSMKKEGITIEVEPTIEPNSPYINLSISPNLVEFEGFVNYGTPIGFTGNPRSSSISSNSSGTENKILMPVFRRISIPNSSFTIQDGETLVIGGLLRSSKEKIEDKTPILGDLPMIGRLFRSEATSHSREAILIFVTAKIIDPTGASVRDR